MPPFGNPDYITNIDHTKRKVRLGNFRLLKDCLPLAVHASYPFVKGGVLPWSGGSITQWLNKNLSQHFSSCLENCTLKHSPFVLLVLIYIASFFLINFNATVISFVDLP